MLQNLSVGTSLTTANFMLRSLRPTATTVVASILLTGCWANRNRSSPCANASTMTALKPDRLPFFLWSMRVPETTVYASRAISRFLSNFPFTMELIYWLLTYWIYQISRATQALTMGEGTWAVAQQHGEWIVWLERVTLADIELPVQHFVMARPVLMYLCNKVCACYVFSSKCTD